MKELTEEDVLRGCKTISVESRNGQMLDVDCRAMSWAATCKVIASDAGETMLHAVLNGVAKEQANDEFLNKLTPLAIVQISSTVMTLTHGISALKKTLAARNPSVQPATPISTPPPASCASTDSPGMK